MRKGLRWKLVVAALLVLAAVYGGIKLDVWYASRQAQQPPATEARP